MHATIFTFDTWLTSRIVSTEWNVEIFQQYYATMFTVENLKRDKPINPGQ